MSAVDVGAEEQWLVDDEGQRWFLYRQGITHQDVPNGVTHVLVPEGVTWIEEQAFNNEEGGGKFDSLKVIKIAKTVEEIGGWAFYDCINLVKVKIPADSNLSIIKNLAFHTCHSLEDISLPQALRSLRSTAFSECRSLRQINFPPQLETLGDHLCFNSSGLKEVDLGHCRLLTTIPGQTFVNCRNLEALVLPPNLQTIDEGAFLGCTALKAITFPRTLQDILESAFEECSALATLEFASFASITALMVDPTDARFPGCTQLHTIKWSRNQGPVIFPALWPRIIANLFWSEEGILESLPSKNRHSCIFSFLCSVKEELMENQQLKTIRPRPPSHPMKTRHGKRKGVHKT